MTRPVVSGGYLGFNIVKEQFESKSQLILKRNIKGALGFNIVKEQFESKSQHSIVTI